MTKKDPNDENPPIFQKWNSWYLLVISFLAFLILLFYLLTSLYE